MRRAHRAVHRLLWPILAILVMFGAAMALALRPPPEPPALPDNAPEARP